MASVPFCNLGDAYGEDWNKKDKEIPKKKNIKSETQDQEQTQQQIPQQLNNLSLDGSLPNIPTFSNAEGCMHRNNMFQNTIAQNTFQLPTNPLNPMGQIGPYQNYLGQNPYMMNVVPNLPISNQMNTWPPQRWAINPNGPIGYENHDPYSFGSRSYFNIPSNNDPYQMFQRGFAEGQKRSQMSQKPNQDFQFVNGQIRENFGSSNRTGIQKITDSVLEYFGSGVNQDQGYQLLQMVLFILVVLFVIQLVEILVNSKVDLD